MGLSTNASLWPFLHTQTHTHAVFLRVKEENILTLKLKLTLFFRGFEYERFTLAFSSHAPEAHKLKPTLTLFFKCEGAKYPHNHTRAFFFSSSLSFGNYMGTIPLISSGDSLFKYISAEKKEAVANLYDGLLLLVFFVCRYYTILRRINPSSVLPVDAGIV